QGPTKKDPEKQDNTLVKKKINSSIKHETNSNIDATSNEDFLTPNMR
ncbi:11798_t:CDS:1, partial [Gigaspora margarita]